MLLRLGRDDEGLAELASLRSLLTQYPDAVSYVSDALEAGGRAEIAEQWLSAALLTALERRDVLAQHGDDPAYSQAAAVAFALAQQRHRARRSEHARAPARGVNAHSSERGARVRRTPVTGDQPRRYARYGLVAGLPHTRQAWSFRGVQPTNRL